MRRLKQLSVSALAAILFSACGLIPEEVDETAGWSAQRIYSEATDSMDELGFERALRLLKKLESRYPYGRYAQQAQLQIAYIHYKTNEDALAIAAADRFIRLHPNHPNVDYAYYLKGLVTFNEDIGLLGALANQDLSERDPKGAKASFEVFRTLTERFPDSRYAEDSRMRMQYLVNSLAKYEVHVARYYYNRGAYVAAANRARSAIQDYPDTPAMEEALFLLARSYEALGLDSLKADASRVFETTYPDSAYPNGGPADERPWWQLW